jgi:serine/threonine-protein kinase
MSPEQIRGDKLDVRSDIFSLGVVLYQTLTLKKPFPADTLTTLVYQILHNEPDDPVRHNEELPPEISEIAAHCLAKNREERYGDAVELADDLRALIGIAPLVSTTGLSESKIGRARAAAAASAAATTTAQPILRPDGPARPAAGAQADVSASRRMTKSGTRTTSTSSQPGPAAIAGAVAGGLVLTGFLVGGFFFLKSQGLFGRGAVPPIVGPVPTATPEAGAPAVPTPTALPGTTPGPETSPTVPATVPTAAGGRTPVPTRTPRPRTSPTPTPAPAATPTPLPTLTPTPPPLSRPDATYITRRFVKLNTSPDQARVFLNGRYIGIADDWDDAGGGSLLTFAAEGRHRLRLAYPGRKDLTIDLVVATNAVEDRVEVDRDLEKGTPAGPTGPPGKIARPDYQTISLARFAVEPPYAMVRVDGHEMGPASKFTQQDMQFKEPGSYEVLLIAPGYQPRKIRVLVSLSTGKERIVIRERMRRL